MEVTVIIYLCVTGLVLLVVHAIILYSTRGEDVTQLQAYTGLKQNTKCKNEVNKNNHVQCQKSKVMTKLKKEG